LILLIVATAVLIVWLLVEIARFALGGLRLANVRAEPVPGASTGQTAASEAARIASAPVHPTSHQRPDQRATTEQPLYAERDVEQAIRDRLYGGHGRRRD
jgi:hypothetical protein